jgi:hypothetical protein
MAFGSRPWTKGMLAAVLSLTEIMSSSAACSTLTRSVTKRQTLRLSQPATACLTPWSDLGR